MVFNLSRVVFLLALLLLSTAFIPSIYRLTSPGKQIDTLSRSSFIFEKLFPDSTSLYNDSIRFPDQFCQVEGVTTFRGGPHRDHPSFGSIKSRPTSLKIKWSYSTGVDTKWAGGAGWTGQPCIIKWNDSIRALMNVDPVHKTDSAFKEVILGSLDGKIYFLDLETGKPSRPFIDIKNPIKGTVSVDPRGWPILYAGQGISNTGDFGIRIFSLVDQHRMYYLNGKDKFAFRLWSAFDSSPLINPAADIMFVGGENGLLYRVDLNSRFMDETPYVDIQPKVLKARYKSSSYQYQGIENSLAGHNDKIYLSDNHGFIQCINANNLSQIWVTRNHDDTDATLVLEQEKDSIPYLYTGNEVDIQGEKGFVFIKKLNGLDGSTTWEKQFACLTIRGDHPVNGGMLSTPVLGKNNSDSLAVFCLSRYGGLYKGLLVALNKKNGDIIWESKLDNYAWSSPLDIYDEAGNMYLFLADSKGYVMLFDGANGSLIYKEKIAELFEASPVAFNNKIVIASRPRKIFCLEVE